MGKIENQGKTEIPFIFIFGYTHLSHFILNSCSNMEKDEEWEWHGETERAENIKQSDKQTQDLTFSATKKVKEYFCCSIRGVCGSEASFLASKGKNQQIIWMLMTHCFPLF